jgi:serine/threonine protein kinase
VERLRFLDSLRQVRLLSESQLDAVLRRFSYEVADHVVSEALMQEGMLTPYQVHMLLENGGRDLVLGPYQILEELGRGGFGCVYKARHVLMNRVVALKVISPELLDNSRARSWFRREVQAVTRLNHPNIVLAYDANEINDVLFLSMEYVAGPSLDLLVRKQGPLPIGMVCAMMHQAGKALQYAHEQGMVHRDIKPANMLVPADALNAPVNGPRPSSAVLIKIVDFGLARLQGKAASGTLTENRGFVGTPEFVSPEQARDASEADIRSDLYSLGCTFYFALTGKKPFRGETSLEIVVKHLEQEPEPVESLRPDLPPALAAILRRLMAKIPDYRFQTPAEFVAELNFLFGLDASRPNLLSTPSLPVVPYPAPRESRPQPQPQVEPDIPRLTTFPSFRGPDQEKSATAILSDAILDQELESLAEPNSGDTCAFQERRSEPEVNHGAPGTASPPEQTFSPPPGFDPASFKTTLHDAWKAWSSLVTVLAAKQMTSLNETQYRELHRALLAACRHGVATSEGPDKARYQRIESLVEPWLSLDVLSKTDAETLASLDRRCRPISAELGMRRETRSIMAAVAVAAFLFAIGLGLMLMPRLGRIAGNFSFTSNGLWRFLETNPFLAIALLLPMAVTVAYFVMVRLLR